MEVEIGKIVEGKVTGITNFGAFILLPGGKNGLVHISEVSHTYVKDIKDHLKIDDAVKVKIISIDEKGKISVSIKKATEEPPRRPAPRNSNNRQQGFSAPRAVPVSEMTFEDKMKMFMQDSDQKMSDIKRNADSKRGGGGYRR